MEAVDTGKNVEWWWWASALAAWGLSKVEYG